MCQKTQMFKKEKFIAKFVRRKEGDIDNRNTFFSKKKLFFSTFKIVQTTYTYLHSHNFITKKHCFFEIWFFFFSILFFINSQILTPSRFVLFGEHEKIWGGRNKLGFEAIHLKKISAHKCHSLRKIFFQGLFTNTYNFHGKKIP